MTQEETQTRLSDFTFTFYFHTLEKEMATHFSTLAWRIPGTGEPGELTSMGSHRVGHDWSDLATVTADTVLSALSISIHLILKIPLQNRSLILSHITAKETASLVAQMVKNLAAVQENRVRFLGREDTLKEKMANGSSILARRIPWTEKPGGL